MADWMLVGLVLVVALGVLFALLALVDPGAFRKSLRRPAREPARRL